MALIKIEGKANLQGKTKFDTGPQSSDFAPTDISGLRLWLDASDTNTLYNATVGGSVVTTDGSAVARWEDKSGNNRHLIQGTVNARPLLKTAIKNGKNVLRFDGLNDTLNLTINDSSNSAFGFVVLNHNSITQSGGGSDRLLRLGFNGTDNRCNAGSGGTFSGKVGVYLGRSADNIRSNTNVDLNPLLLAFGRSNNGNGQFFLNGTLVGTNTPILGGNATTLTINVGGTGNGLLNGDVYEVIVFSAPLSDTNRQLVETYLNAKWNVY